MLLHKIIQNIFFFFWAPLREPNLESIVAKQGELFKAPLVPEVSVSFILSADSDRWLTDRWLTNKAFLPCACEGAPCWVTNKKDYYNVHTPHLRQTLTDHQNLNQPPSTFYSFYPQAVPYMVIYWFLIFCMYASVLVITVARGIMMLSWMSICLSQYCECYISRMPWGTFFKFGTNTHNDSRMNWLKLGGQRSRSLWPPKTPFCPCCFTQMSNSKRNYEVLVV